ncbi:MAG TPA: FAD-binding oxidoreductase, partial [Patescibacteria group bacterium]|nr:FAD-binding oxidoreductase [Patescibacteria group bacterium]
MFLVEARIAGRRAVARGMFVIALEAPEIAASARAGQFVNLGWSPGPLLRRPFSVYRAEDGQIEVVLKEVGAGTAQLLAMDEGDRVSCLGPLGRG